MMQYLRERNVVGNIFLNDRRSLKHLVKSNCKNSTAELTAKFNSESKNTMQRELKELGLNCYVASRKTIIYGN